MKIKRLMSLFSLFGAVAHATDWLNTIVATDSPASKLTNHVRNVYAKEVQFKALPIMRFHQFAKIKEELLETPGQTIQMMSYENLAMGGALTEGVRMTGQKLSSSMKSITISERGNAVKVSELALKTSFRDIMADAVNLLSRDMALVLDCELRDKALSGPNQIVGRKDATITPITDALLIADADLAKYVMSTTTVKDAVEILSTNNTPKVDGDSYIQFVHPHCSRTLRDDAAWLDANKYNNAENIFRGEIGRIEDVRFIESTLMCNGAAAATDPGYKAALKTTAGSKPLYQSVIFGEDYYALAIGLPVELRDDGVTDYGREHGIAWYAIWGTALLNSDRGVVITTT